MSFILKREKPFDCVSFVCDYENGFLNEEKIINGFQHLIDSGLVWTLQGSYGRMAIALIKQGFCTDTHNVREQA